jgi:transposase
LQRSLMAYLRGEPKEWSVVLVPSVAEEDARRLHRERDRLVLERVQHVNASRGFARSMASTIIIRCPRRRWLGWSNCARHKAASFRHG